MWSIGNSHTVRSRSIDYIDLVWLIVSDYTHTYYSLVNGNIVSIFNCVPVLVTMLTGDRSTEKTFPNEIRTDELLLVDWWIITSRI